MDKLYRIATIGIGTMAGPGILFLLPYILPLSRFADFAATMAIAQLIICIGGFGLDVSCPRLAIDLKRAAIYSLLTLSAASVVVFIGFGDHLSEKFVLAFPIAWATALTAIFHSYSLFAGKTNLYGLMGLTKALAFLGVLVTLIYLGVSPAVAWLLAALVGLTVALLLLTKIGDINFGVASEQSTWRKVIQFSTPMAIIVAAGALPFVLDRALAQHLLSTSEFARYAVAVTWATPVVYIGNIIHQSMIAAKKNDTMEALMRWAGGYLVAGVIYVAIIVILSLYYIKVPYFSDSADFIRLWGLIVGWYLIYSSISFPVAAIMQKNFSAEELKSLAGYTVGSILFASPMLYGVYSLLNSWEVLNNKTIGIILFTGLLATIGVAPKIMFVLKFVSK